MKTSRRPLIFLIAALPLILLGWYAVQLSATRLHILGADGRICPCEFSGISRLPDGAYRLGLPDAPGEVIWVAPDSLTDEVMFTEAYVLPWFGRTRAKVNPAGEALIRP